MISRLDIQNFKCFGRAAFDIRPLTVLTGVNGGGKSTLLQSLLLARMASTATPGRVIQLNGPYGLTLGGATDVLHWAASDPTIGIKLSDASASSDWNFRFGIPGQEGALHLTIDDVPATAPPGVGNSPRAFTYLCAERLGPRDTLSVSAAETDEIGVGVQGEFTAQVLALHETRAIGDSTRRTVRDSLRHPDAGSPSPRPQTEAWASDIIRPIRITAQLAIGIMASTIRFEQGTHSSDVIRPANTGFGVSYALPIIVAGVLTQSGDMLLVENPEAHLHPAGQSKLGRFLARVAGSGVQVVVETHSDHVLNGARLAVADDRSLNASDMIVHYFAQDQNLPIGVNDMGELDQWPVGFFDQVESDLGRLVRARRTR